MGNRHGIFKFNKPMHLPLGLTCGHKACLECALEAAGLQHMKGRLSAVLLNAPRAAVIVQIS